MGKGERSLEIILNRRVGMRFPAVILLILLFTACSKVDAPVLRSIDSLNVDTGDSLISISGQGRFYNPNKSKMLLKSADIAVSVNDQQFTRIKKDFNLTILPEQEFVIPLSLDLNRRQVKSFLKRNAVQLLLGNGVHVKYKGNIKVRAHGFGIKVPVNEEKSINLRDFL